MKRWLDILIFVGLIALIGIANKELFGYSFSKEAAQEEASFDPSLQIVETLYSSELAPKVTGYGGVISMAIGTDAQGVIKDIKILKNSETPEFFQQVLNSSILDNWIGKDIQTAANLEVDAISGATMSSDGVIKTVKTSLNAKLGKATTGTELSWKDLTKALSISFVAILGLLSFFAPKKSKIFKTTFAVCSIAILGIWQGTMLSLAKISNWILSGIPNVLEIPLLLILLASLIIPAFTGKNFYCYHLCPFGAAQDLVTKGITFKLKVKIYHWMSHLRIVVLIVCFMLVLFGLATSVTSFEPFSAFKAEYAPLAAIVIFATALVVSTFLPRAWCRFFCPCGAFLDLFKGLFKKNQRTPKRSDAR